MSRLARLLALVALILAPAWLVPARADDAAEIRAVIARQLEAFGRDDWAAAFEHASPSIQRMFVTPERFGGMVRGGYPMVWRPARVDVGVLETGPRGPVQLMYFEDDAGARYEAAYEMVEIDGVWRINGVFVRRAPDAAV
jgi:hypothetical protein